MPEIDALDPDEPHGMSSTIHPTPEEVKALMTSMSPRNHEIGKGQSPLDGWIEIEIFYPLWRTCGYVAVKALTYDEIRPLMKSLDRGASLLLSLGHGKDDIIAYLVDNLVESGYDTKVKPYLQTFVHNIRGTA